MRVNRERDGQWEKDIKNTICYYIFAITQHSYKMLLFFLTITKCKERE